MHYNAESDRQKERGNKVLPDLWEENIGLQKGRWHLARTSFIKDIPDAEDAMESNCMNLLYIPSLWCQVQHHHFCQSYNPVSKCMTGHYDVCLLVTELKCICEKGEKKTSKSLLVRPSDSAHMVEHLVIIHG